MLFRRVSLLLTLLILMTSAATAAEPFEQKPLAMGFVASVNPFTRVITIHGGLLAIDAFEAEVRGPVPDSPRTFADIRPGAKIAVVFKPGTYSPGQAIPATIVQILEQEAGTITGKVEAVSAANKTFTVLGQVIRTTDRTQFGSTIASLDKNRVEDLPIGQDITAFINSNLTALTADSVYLIAPPADQHIIFTGIVRKIEGNTWTLMRSNIETFKVTSRTSIEAVPTPRVGDQIQVTGRVDNGEVTAISIRLARVQCPNFTPNPTFSMKGFVVERTASFIRFDTGNRIVRARFDDETLFDGGEAGVGDNVDVRVEKIGNEFLAKFVMKLNYRTDFFFFGTVRSISASEWLIESEVSHDPDDRVELINRRVVIDSSTVIHNAPGVGSKVVVVAEREANGDIKGKMIDLYGPR